MKKTALGVPGGCCRCGHFLRSGLRKVQNATLQGSTSFSFPSGVDKTYAIGVCNVCHTGRSNYWKRPPHSGN